MNGRLQKLYWWLESLINPGAESSQYVYERSLRKRISSSTTWLDAGCGTSIMPWWVPGQVDLIGLARTVFGMDPLMGALESNKQIHYRVAGKLEDLPFSAESLSLVSANMVVEHVENPAKTLAEVERVLVPGGRFVFHTPNKHHYLVFIASLLPQWFKGWMVKSTESRTPFKTFYRFNTIDRIEELAHSSGFVVDELQCTDTSSSIFIYFGPFVIPMLLYARFLRLTGLNKYGSNLVVVLRKYSHRTNTTVPFGKMEDNAIRES
ncbi:MAG: class I SAM-dependent methyltransferase [Candidatus Acidiferrales bacterium]